MIVTVSCVLLWHARHFSQQPHVFGLLATKVSVVHLHVQWPCLRLFEQNQQSRGLLPWCTLWTVRTFTDLRKCEKLWHNPSTRPPVQGICQWLSCKSSQLMLSSSLRLWLWLQQSLSVLRSRPVQSLDNTVQCAPPYGICSIPEYPSNWCGDLHALNSVPSIASSAFSVPSTLLRTCSCSKRISISKLQHVYSIPSHLLIVIAVDSAILSSIHVSSLSVLLWDFVDNGEMQNLKPSQVRQISKVPRLITCSMVSGVLNLSIARKLTDAPAKSNWDVHNN